MSPAQIERAEGILRLCAADLVAIPLTDVERHADWMAATLIHLACGRDGIAGIGVEAAHPYFLSLLEADFREPAADTWISIVSMLGAVADLLRRDAAGRAS